MTTDLRETLTPLIRSQLSDLCRAHVRAERVQPLESLAEAAYRLGLADAVALVPSSPVTTPERYPQDLTDAMNEDRWHDATFILIWKVDALYKELAQVEPEKP